MPLTVTYSRSASATSVNHDTQAAVPEEEDTTNEAELSPPPDSSSVSSIAPDVPGDEIVVGLRDSSPKNPARATQSERGDDEPAEVEIGERSTSGSHYPKRKRSSIYEDLAEDKMKGVEEVNSQHPPPKPYDAKHVTLGYWRDSQVPDEKNKHCVVGFIDSRDRLRTRIQCNTRTKEHINTRIYPIPPGPGGSWVTFERVVFNSHLVGLDHNEVKEYVKIRSEQNLLEESSNERHMSEIAAAKEAQRRIAANPPPETAQPPHIAWGKEIPEHAQSGRPEKRRRTAGNVASTASPTTGNALPLQRASSVVQPPQQTRGISPAAGFKPVRILIGCWTKSNAEDDAEKHAVFGILGANDMFRVKLMRETMDGRYCEGNFPTGAGALWINYDEVKFLPHLQNLTRPEVKEYIRIRQKQLDAGETEETKVANEMNAVYEAQRRAALPAKYNFGTNGAHRQSGTIERDDIQDDQKTESREQEPRSQVLELRQTRRDTMSQPTSRALRHSLPEASGLRQNNRRGSNEIERQRGLVSQSLEQMELNQSRNERSATQRAAVLGTIPAHDVRRDFNDNIQRMDRIWQAQELTRQGGLNNDNVKMHEGVKYERKRNGPFEGKLVSQGTIISIDGEDYVEYRVLTKPTFF